MTGRFVNPHEDRNRVGVFSMAALGAAAHTADSGCCADGQEHVLGPRTTFADGGTIVAARPCYRCRVIVTDVVRLTA